MSKFASKRCHPTIMTNATYLRHFSACGLQVMLERPQFGVRVRA